ncbi:MAG TPA: glutamine amidotransferase [Polyangiales bacterium]
MPKPLLFLQVGHTFEEIARERGDYEVWFQAALGQSDAEFEVRKVYAGAGLPDHFDYRGIVVSGSWSMVTDHEPWSDQSGAYLRSAAAHAVPILGVCYGHQLLADAFGGQVGYNPRGRHAGTARVLTTPAVETDALFGPLPRQLVVQVSHSQSVLALPPGAVLLAHAEGDPNQAFRLGERTWGVQFHPEFDHEVSRRYIELRRERIREEGLDPEALIAGVRPSPHGAQLLRRFAQLLD